MDNNSRKHELEATEQDTKLLGCFTSDRYGEHPEYWNLTMVRMKGDVVLTVRLLSGSGQPPGQTSSVRFSRELWRSFVSGLPDANKVFEAVDSLDAEM